MAESTTSRILGPDGQPLERKLLTREIADAQLTGRRSVWNFESVASFLTPTRLADVLTRANHGDIYDFLTLAEEMEERDPHYAGVLGTRKRAVSGIEPEISAADEDPRSEEIAEAVRDMIARVGFSDLVEDAMDALGKGFSCTEIIWETSAKQWWPARFEWRDPRFFVFDQVTGSKILLLTDDEPFGRALPAFKFITHTPRIKCGLPIRGSLGRLVAVAYLCKSVALADWMTFAELFGMPIRIGMYGPNALPEEKATLRNAVANIGSDAAAIIPESMKIEFQEASKGTGGHELYEKLSEWLDRQVSKGVLGQTMSSDAQSAGLGSGNAQVHNDVRDDILRADLRQLATTLNRDVVRPFVDFNYGPQQRYPELYFPIAEPEDIEGLVNALEKLVPLGLRVSTKAVLDKLGLPEPEQGAVVLKAPAPAAAWPTDSYGGPGGRADLNDEPALNRQQPGPGDSDIEALADAGLADWQAQMEPLLSPVHALAARSATAEAFIAGLPALLDEMDDTVLVRELALQAFKARGLGESTDDV